MGLGQGSSCSYTKPLCRSCQCTLACTTSIDMMQHAEAAIACNVVILGPRCRGWGSRVAHVLTIQLITLAVAWGSMLCSTLWCIEHAATRMLELGSAVAWHLVCMACQMAC